MRQAIVTKYLGPTNYRGSRVKASAQAGSITIPWNDALDSDDNHAAAAIALCRKFAWTGRLACGGLPDGTGNVYVFAIENPLEILENDSINKLRVDREIPRKGF